MKEFFLILFFSKIILLTPTPVNLSSQWLEITPKSPMQAVTGGASLHIAISSNDPLLKNPKENGVENLFSELEKVFPSGTLIGKLVTSNGDEILLSDGGFSISDFSLSQEGAVKIILDGDDPISTDLSFERVLIRSRINLSGVRIYWKNYLI